MCGVRNVHPEAGDGQEGQQETKLLEEVPGEPPLNLAVDCAMEMLLLLLLFVFFFVLCYFLFFICVIVWLNSPPPIRGHPDGSRAPGGGC